MAYRVEVQARAKRDLLAIASFIQTNDSAHARSWFIDLMDLILSYP